MKKKSLIMLWLVPLVILQVGNAWARPGILTEWQTRYPGSLTEDTVQCQLCHQKASGGEPWNDYGWAIRVVWDGNDNDVGAAIAAVEMANSDADPFLSTNVAEIEANTQPGWTPGANNTIHFKDGSFTVDQMSPIELAAIVQDLNSDPYLNVTPDSLDFGQVKKARSGTLEVLLANIGQSDLSISSVNLCVGTSTEFTTSILNQSNFVSGSSEVLAISFNPTNTGLEEGCIEIVSNDPDQTTKVITISGEGVNKVTSGDGSNPINSADVSSLIMVKALTGESINANGIAELDEILTYTITLSNTSKNEVTVGTVTETVPLGSVYTGSGDFVCTALAAGSSCEAVNIVIPGKNKGVNGTATLSFSMMVNTQFLDIENTVSVIGIDCAAIENNCIVITPADSGDIVNPALSVLSPGEGSVVSENGFTVNGTASDASGIDTVIVNDGTDHQALYSSIDATWSVDLESPVPGTEVVLTVTATDSNGNVTVAPSINVTINTPDLVAPTLTVTSPVNNGSVAVTGFTVNGTADDAGGIASVIVFVGSSNYPATYSQGTTSWSVDLPPYPEGNNLTLIVTATDNSGNQTVISDINVTVLLSQGTINHVRHLINRISYGITPAQLAALNGVGGGFDLAAYRTEQLTSTDCLDPAFVKAPGGIFDGVASPSANLLTLPVAHRNDLQNYAILMAAHNNCQLREVLTQFWDNHFNTDWDAVNSKSGGVTQQTTAWELAENDFFRANALGNFRDLLEGSGKSRAMIYYLDGITNINTAPNENYGRELMELHTLSVDGGYTDQDVVNAAKAFTGWTVNDPIDSDPLTDTSEFTCDPALHDYSDIVLDLGDGVDAHLISTPIPHNASSCELAGQAVFDLLIQHTSTGEFICEKLTELLVSDNITPAVVSACESAFAGTLDDDDQIAQVVEAILMTTEFTNTNDYLDKIKTPLELTAGYLRNFNVGNLGVIPSVALSSDLDDLRGELDQMSMSLFRFNTPDGFSEQSVDWISSGFMQRRLAFISDMTLNTSTTGDIYLDPMAFFTTHVPSFTAVDIVDYVMELAMQNQHTELERDQALAVLNNLSDAVDASGNTFDLETDTAIKRNRLRVMLAVVLNYPGYQYQ